MGQEGGGLMIWGLFKVPIAPPPQNNFLPPPQLVLPGSPEEMGGFVGGALGGSWCALQLRLPCAHLRLSPPQLLQRLYNRWGGARGGGGGVIWGGGSK